MFWEREMFLLNVIGNMQQIFILDFVFSNSVYCGRVEKVAI